MVSALVRRWFSKVNRKKDTPWAMFEVETIDENGRVKLAFDYNDVFVERIKAMGFQAETDEDTVQLFFATAGLRPMSLIGDPNVQSDNHPQLSSPSNILVE